MKTSQDYWLFVYFKMMTKIIGLLLAMITCVPAFCQKRNDVLEISSDAFGFITFSCRSQALSNDGLSELRKLRAWLQSDENAHENSIILSSVSADSNSGAFGILRCRTIVDSLTGHGVDASIFYIAKDVFSETEDGVRFIIEDKYKRYVDPKTMAHTEEVRKPNKNKRYKNNCFEFQSNALQLTEEGEDYVNKFKKWVESAKHTCIVNLYGVDSEDNATSDFALKACEVIRNRLSSFDNVSLIFIRPQIYPGATRNRAVYFTVEEGPFDERKVKDDEYFKQ